MFDDIWTTKRLAILILSFDFSFERLASETVCVSLDANTSKISRVFPTATNVDSRPDFRVYRTPWKLSRSVDALPFLSQSSSSFPYSRNRVCTLPAAVCVHSYVFLRQMQHRLFRSEITQNLRLLLMLYTARACFPLAMLSTFRHTYLCCILSVCVHIDNC